MEQSRNVLIQINKLQQPTKFLALFGFEIPYNEPKS